VLLAPRESLGKNEAMARVFLSYRRIDPDEKIAESIYRRLVALGHEVFFDQNEIEPGVAWSRLIDKKIGEAEWFIALVSSSFVDDDRVILHQEVEPAVRRLVAGTLRILPISIAYNGDLPKPLAPLAELQSLEWRSHADTSSIIEQIERILPGPPRLVRGMRSFEVTDGIAFAELGRGEEVHKLREILAANPSVVVVLGESGAGKSSLVLAGLVPGMTPPPRIFREYDGAARLAQSGDALVVMDQFDEALTRAAKSPATHESLKQEMDGFASGGGRLLLCLREDYWSALETMLPAVAGRALWFHVRSFSAESGAQILMRLLREAHVSFEIDFVRQLCLELARDGVIVPSVRPAILQLIAQRVQAKNWPLNADTWQRLRGGRDSVFESHVSEEFLPRLPEGLSRLEALRTLSALVAGETRSRSKTLDEVARDAGVTMARARQALEHAAFSSVRIVQMEAGDPLRYRLQHALFASAIGKLRREEERRRSVIRSGLSVGAIGVLALSSLIGIAVSVDRSRVAEMNRMAASRHLAQIFRDRGAAALDKHLGQEAEVLYAKSLTLEEHPDARAALPVARYMSPRLEQITVPGQFNAMCWLSGAAMALASCDSIVVLDQRGEVSQNFVRHWPCAQFPPVVQRSAALQCSTRGMRIASARSDRTQVWDALSGALVLDLAIENVVSIALSEDGSELAIGKSNGEIELRNLVVPGSKTKATIQSGVGHLDHLVFSPKGDLLALDGANGEPVEVWSLNDLRRWRVYPLAKKGDSSLAFSLDGAVLYGSRGQIELATGALLAAGVKGLPLSNGATVTLESRSILGLDDWSAMDVQVQFGAGGFVSRWHAPIASMGVNASVQGSTISTWGPEPIFARQGLESGRTMLETWKVDRGDGIFSYHADPQLLWLDGETAYLQKAFSVSLMDAKQMPLLEMGADESNLGGVQGVLSRGDQLVIPHGRGIAKWDWRQKLLLQKLVMPSEAWIDVTRDLKTAVFFMYGAYAQGNPAVTLLDIDTGAQKPVFDEFGISYISLSADGSRLAVATIRNLLRLWDSDGVPIGRSIPVPVMNEMRLSPDGGRVAIFTREGLQMVDTRSLALIPDFDGGQGAVSDGCFSEDGSLIVALRANAIDVRESSSGRLLHSMRWARDLPTGGRFFRACEFVRGGQVLRVREAFGAGWVAVDLRALERLTAIPAVLLLADAEKATGYHLNGSDLVPPFVVRLSGQR
jgi:hypothetical protein